MQGVEPPSIAVMYCWWALASLSSVSWIFTFLWVFSNWLANCWTNGIVCGLIGSPSHTLSCAVEDDPEPEPEPDEQPTRATATLVTAAAASMTRLDVIRMFRSLLRSVQRLMRGNRGSAPCPSRLGSAACSSGDLSETTCG
jgi:hypothetical protein